MKRKVLIYASYLVSLVFLYLTLEGIDYKQLTASLRGIELNAIIVASVIYLSTFLVRGLRVKLILDNEVGNKVAVSSNLIAYALNNFIPLKGGDIYKIYFLSKRGGVRKSVSTATVLIERLFDLASVLIIFSIVIYYINIDTSGWNMTNLVVILVALMFLMIISIFIINKFKHINIESFIKVANPDSLHVFIECWQRLLRHRHFASVLGLSVIIWSMEAMLFYVILGYSDLLIAVVWMCTLALSFVIPNAPGNIGLFEWVSIFVLSRFGLGEEQALSLGLVAHSVQFVSVTVIGLIIYFVYKKFVQNISVSGISD